MLYFLLVDKIFPGGSVFVPKHNGLLRTSFSTRQERMLMHAQCLAMNSMTVDTSKGLSPTNLSRSLARHVHSIINPDIRHVPALS